MLQNTTYKQRNWLLLAGIGFFALLVYFLALKKTLSLASECSVLKEQIMSNDNAPDKITRLEAQIKELDAKAGLSQENIEFQQGLLEKISAYSAKNRVSLKEFPAHHVFASNDIEIETNQVKLEGSFLNLLNLVFSLEQVDRIGKVISVNYETVTDVRTKQVSLTAKIYIQNVQKTSTPL